MKTAQDWIAVRAGKLRGDETLVGPLNASLEQMPDRKVTRVDVSGGKVWIHFTDGWVQETDRDDVVRVRCA